MSTIISPTKPVDDIMIAIYVPDAEYMSHQDALDLAMQRDTEAALNLCESASVLNMEAAVAKAMHDLGY